MASTATNGDETHKERYDYDNSTIEQDREAAAVVLERVERKATLKKQKAKEDAKEGEEEDKAAKLMQNQYRGYVDRRSQSGLNLTSSERWSSGLKHRALKDASDAQDKGTHNSAADRWQRTGVYASQIAGPRSPPASTASVSTEGGTKTKAPKDQPVGLLDKFARSEKERRKMRAEEDGQATKTMEPQYFLEIVDRKHRYGTNLKWYHAKWNEENTDQNFFYWLDEGAGKDVDLEQCPRARLDKECIVYLTEEQRQAYVVIVEKETGKLLWKKNNVPVDTTVMWKDAGPGKGIVELSEEEKAQGGRKMEFVGDDGKVETAGGASDSDSSSLSSSDEEAIRGGVHGYGDKGGTKGQGKGLQQFKDRMKYYASPQAVMDRTLRKTINKNTWLYVCDTRGNLYVSIKRTGQFQHSSLIYGSRVTSAGLIKVDNGQLRSLSPLSGHYRAGSMHFKAFVRHIESIGCDMSRVSISKSLMVIKGIEKYGKAQKKRKGLTAKFKEKLRLKEKEEDPKEKEEEETAEIAAKQQLEDGDTTTSSTKSAVKTFNKPLPHEGKNKEDLTEDERMERGVALVARAMSRGLLDESDEDEEEA